MVEIEFKFKTDFSCWCKNSVNLIYSVGNSFIPEEIFLKIGTKKLFTEIQWVMSSNLIQYLCFCSLVYCRLFE